MSANTTKLNTDSYRTCKPEDVDLDVGKLPDGAEFLLLAHQMDPMICAVIGFLFHVKLR